MPIDVSIIIVNYNTKRLVRDCIASIQKLTKDISYEIIIVDNASEDISEFEAPGVKVVRLHDNIGFGGANNRGAELAQGEALFFLNPDTVLLNNAVALLYRALYSNDRYGIVGSNLYDADLQPMHSYYYCTMTMSHVWRYALRSDKKLSHISLQHNFSNHEAAVEFITGADLMIRADLFNRLGGFHKSIFMYYEDVDLCFRAGKAGHKCMSIPAAHIQHLEGQSFKPTSATDSAIKNQKKAMSAKSIAAFLHNNYSTFHGKLIIRGFLFVISLKLIAKHLAHRNTSGLKHQKEFFNQILANYNETGFN